MNKELILKYRDEFDHWLKEGKLLVKAIGDSSEWISMTSIALWDAPPSLISGIVLDDEYVEFRKALVDGKTIQYLNTEERLYNSSKPLNTWIDTNSIHSHGLPSDYRIKPKEPRFKVGDWISQGDYVLQVHRITDLAYHDNGGKAIKLEMASLWKPKLGEWCWFWADGCNPTLNKFIKMNESLYEIELLQTSITVFVSNCQPFIGTLPSFLDSPEGD